jgi:hypothetical protein
LNAQAARLLYSDLNRSAQIKLLSRFGFNLTIAARDTYEAGTEEVTDPQRLRRINEIQHRVFGHISSLIKNDPDRYPDDVLISILLEHPDLTLRAYAEQAFSEAARYATVAT